MAKTTYDPKLDFLKLADDYLASCGRNQTKLPKTSEFCRDFIGKNEDTISKWLNPEKGVAKNDDKLKAAIAKVKERQKEQLMDDGLYGGREVNNAMAIFLLKANHGFIETERKEIVGNNGEALSIRIIEDIRE